MKDAPIPLPDYDIVGASTQDADAHPNPESVAGAVGGATLPDLLVARCYIKAVHELLDWAPSAYAPVRVPPSASPAGNTSTHRT